MRQHVMVVGDVIIDEYTHGTRLGLAAETPTIVAKQGHVETYVGGAGLVVRHLLRLGCEVTMVSLYGHSDDSPKDLMKQSGDPPTKDELDQLNDVSFRPLADGWQVTRKRRFFVDDYKLLQFDILNEGDGEELALKKRFVDGTSAFVEGWKPDAVVICDNRHGMSPLLHDLVQNIRVFKIPIYVDSQVSQSKESNLSGYEGADYFLMNERELDAFLVSFAKDWGRSVDIDELQLVDKIYKASSWLGGGDIIVKLGAEGSASLIRGRFEKNTAFPVQAVDTCGAGDAFMAAFVVTGDLLKANMWAGLSTTYKGTIVPKETL